MMHRPDHNEYFMCIALMAAQRASCPRRKVGCVLVDSNKHIISTGYNGPSAGLPNCTTQPCGGHSHKSGEGLSSCIAIHAEVNALTQAGNRLIDVKTMYVTTQCCDICTDYLDKLIIDGKLPKLDTIFFFDGYSQKSFDETFKKHNIIVSKLGKSLPDSSLLLKTAIMLGLRKEYIPPSIICVGGPAHGRLYTYDEVKSDFMRIYVADMKPDEYKVIDNSPFNESVGTKEVLRKDYADYYKENYVVNHNRFRIFRFADLSQQEFERLFAEVRMSPQFSHAGY